MAGLGSCSICGKNADTVYPLLAGSPAFCHGHHNPRDAGPFGCDFTGPDDFDIPFDEFDVPFATYRPRMAFLRATFVWTDKKGVKHLLTGISDVYLQNIVGFLNRKLDLLPPFEDAPKMDTLSTEREQARLENLIEFLEGEQTYRKKHRIVVNEW